MSLRFALTSADGRILAMAGISTDVTARHRAEERFRRAFEAAPIGMALMSLDGRFPRVNPALCTITGFEAAELEATSDEAVTHPDDLSCSPQGRWETLDDDAAGFFECDKRYITAGGHAVSVQMHVALFDGSAVTPEAMIVNADLAMYDAKEAGRDRMAMYATAEHRHSRAKARLTWVARMDRALKEDGYLLEAQPIRDLETGEISQYELLIRHARRRRLGGRPGDRADRRAARGRATTPRWPASRRRARSPTDCASSAAASRSTTSTPASAPSTTSRSTASSSPTACATRPTG